MIIVKLTKSSTQKMMWASSLLSMSMITNIQVPHTLKGYLYLQ